MKLYLIHYQNSEYDTSHSLYLGNLLNFFGSSISTWLVKRSKLTVYFNGLMVQTHTRNMRNTLSNWMIKFRSISYLICAVSSACDSTDVPRAKWVQRVELFARWITKAGSFCCIKSQTDLYFTDAIWCFVTPETSYRASSELLRNFWILLSRNFSQQCAVWILQI